MKRVIAAALVLLLLCGCAPRQSENGLSVVATVFPAYDFARAVAGENAQVQMLLDPGTEVHTYDPSPEDILKIENADVFIYTGGDSDVWVDKVLSTINTENKKIIRMTDHSELIYGHGEDEHTHEHDNHDHSHKHGADEHVWLSPDNAKSIVSAIAAALAVADKENASVYEENAQSYNAQITEHAEQTAAVVEKAKAKTLVVADRFPLKYLCHYYSLSYDAAFDACDLLADADAKTVLRLINTVRENGLKYVFYIENGSGYLADTVCEETGAERIMINSLHSISAEAFAAGITYIDVMEQNKEALRRGLG